MFKNITVFLVFIFSAHISEAQNLYYPSTYFKGGIGGSKVSDYNDASGTAKYGEESLSSVQMAYGSSVSNVSFEGELSLNFHEFEFQANDPINDYNGDLVASTLMLNAMYKTHPTASGLYFGGGLGYLSASMEGFEDRLKGSSLAAQVFAGIEFKFNRQSALYLEARHIKSLGLELENDFAYIDYEYKQTGVNFGVKYFF